MAFWWTCSKCGKFITVDSAEECTMLEVFPEHRDASKRYLCESCMRSFDEWLAERTLDIDKRNKVIIGDVCPLPASSLADKAFPKKVLEEAAEVYSAWENYRALGYQHNDEEREVEALCKIIEESCDLIQTASNLIWAAGKDYDLVKFGQSSAEKVNRIDVRPILREIMMRNVEKGRYDV